MATDLHLEREVDERIIALVADARSCYGIPEGTSGRDACRAFGVGLAFADLAPRDGLLARNPDQVLVDSSIEWASRVDFTIYHELTHYLLDEEGDIIEFYTEALRDDERAYERAIERCCHAGAAEFLLPRRCVREAINRSGFSIALIEELSAVHGSSVLATANQLATWAPMECYVVVCTHGRSWLGSHNDCLHVEQAAKRPDMKYPLVRGSVIPQGHLFDQVWTSGQASSGPSIVPFRTGTKMKCVHGEARMIRSRVAGILYVKQRPLSKDQLSLGL